MMTQKTKIICTIGPTSWDNDTIEAFVAGGLDIARFNFSHQVYEHFLEKKTLIDIFNKKYNKQTKIMMDLQGPRMRVGELPEEGLELKKGQYVYFSTDPKNKEAIYINDPYLHDDIEPGHPIYLASGDMELMVLEKDGTVIKTQVVRGGKLYSRKGVNLPETILTTKGLTEKDIKDVEFGIKNNVDYIALSFVQDAEDVYRLQQVMQEFTNGKKVLPKIIAKIETKPATRNLDGIIAAADGIMIARGDLGIELPIEDIPIMQRLILKKCHKAGKPAIVATQMLTSMINRPRPTHAEISDIANAVYGGSWAVMLTDETAFGKYPIQAFHYMKKTIRKIEQTEQDGVVSIS